MHIPEVFLNLVFPPKCIFCGTLLSVSAEINICDECYSRIPFLNGVILSADELDVYKNYCDEILCVCEYSHTVKKVIMNLKFFNKPSYHRALGKLAANKLKKMTNYNRFDIILSVPLSRGKLSKRGYNQSKLIASIISKETGIPERSALILRERETRSQSLLSKRDRYINVRDAFIVRKPEEICGRSVILVDDVLTTGNTVNECSRVLKEAGAYEVITVVVASGRKFIDCY